MRTILTTIIAAALVSCESKAPTTTPDAAAPRSAELRTSEPPPPVEPVKVWVCCPAGGDGPCIDVDSDVTQCKAPDKLIYCCGPITTPNGVTCGC